MMALALTAAACSTVAPPATDPAQRLSVRAFEAADDTTATTLRASDLLHPEMLKGQYFEVDETVRNNGLVNAYSLASPFGRFEAHGDDRLRYLENELEVLGAFKECDPARRLRARHRQRSGELRRGGCTTYRLSGASTG
jgi:hypothetical protein